MILQEAIEAAAKAAYIYHSNEPGFDAEAAWNDMAGAEDWERGQWELEAQAALEAAAPFLRAQALEDAAQELVRLHGIGRTAQGKCSPEEKADYYAYAEHDGDHSAWLKARAATERGEA